MFTVCCMQQANFYEKNINSNDATKLDKLAIHVNVLQADGVFKLTKRDKPKYDYAFPYFFIN